MKIWHTTSKHNRISERDDNGRLDFFLVFKINCLSCLQRNTNKLFFSFCWRILFLQDRNSSNEYRYLISLRITWYNAHFFGFCLSDFCGSSSGANINFLHGWNLDFHDFSLFLVHKCWNVSHPVLQPHPPPKKTILTYFWTILRIAFDTNY